MIFAKRAYLDKGWTPNVRLAVHDGVIAEILENAEPDKNDLRVDTLLPALSNLHSHSFQRAMAGMTEFRAKGRESFWTWRDLMYRFLDRLTPDHIRAIAGLAFMEMQEAGFAAVGEFHYVHHSPDGKTYDNPAELSLQIMEAARETGIGLTHLPVLYTRGGVDGEPLAGGQLRFGNTVAEFSELVTRCRMAANDLPLDTRIGVAPHSLRAVTPDDLSHVLAQHPTGPIHIHIAEQVKEVAEVQSRLGARPVQWLLDSVDIDDRWCLIHATHMTDAETSNMARSGAIAGLCPITEANLGDGIFNGAGLIAAHGGFGIGTDSNINITLTEELRSLEYAQRLHRRERNVMVANEGSVGETLYVGAAKGGAQALNRDAGAIAVGKLADLVAIDSNDPALAVLGDSQILDGYVFAANDRVVTDLWSAGRHQVRAGRHVAREQIVASYRRAMTNLTSALDQN